jgi:hypothetical protein
MGRRRQERGQTTAAGFYIEIIEIEIIFTIHVLTITMASFLSFLSTECSSIQAFIESGLSLEEENILMIPSKIEKHISSHPQLQEYFDIDHDMNRFMSKGAEVSTEANALAPWSVSLRVAVIDYLITMDINISLLLEIVGSYRFEAEIGELVEIVRGLDILGAEKRLSEYEAILYIKLKQTVNSTIEWERLCGDRIPVSYFDHVKNNQYLDYSSIIGSVGSQRLIEYFLLKINYQSTKDKIFVTLCSEGHLSVAQWLHNTQGSVNIHAENEKPFRMSCYHGHLSIAQWLHSFGVNIYAENDQAFRYAVSSGHLLVIQWLHSLDYKYFYKQNNWVFRAACSQGHLSVAQWIYSFGDLNIHVNNDQVLRLACSCGHLAVAQWLYSLGGVNIHAEDNEAYEWARGSGHLLVAEWLNKLISDNN